MVLDNNLSFLINKEFESKETFASNSYILFKLYYTLLLTVAEFIMHVSFNVSTVQLMLKLKIYLLFDLQKIENVTMASFAFAYSTVIVVCLSTIIIKIF